MCQRSHNGRNDLFPDNWVSLLAASVAGGRLCVGRFEDSQLERGPLQPLPETGLCGNVVGKEPSSQGQLSFMFQANSTWASSGTGDDVQSYGLPSRCLRRGRALQQRGYSNLHPGLPGLGHRQP